MAETANTYQSLSPIMKDVYASDIKRLGTEPTFAKLKAKLKKDKKK